MQKYKYLCPFGDEHKFKDDRQFMLHLVHVHDAEVTISTRTFILKTKREEVYELDKYQIKEEEEPKKIISTEPE